MYTKKKIRGFHENNEVSRVRCWIMPALFREPVRGREAQTLSPEGNRWCFRNVRRYFHTCHTKRMDQKYYWCQKVHIKLARNPSRLPTWRWQFHNIRRRTTCSRWTASPLLEGFGKCVKMPEIKKIIQIVSKIRNRTFKLKEGKTLLYHLQDKCGL